MKPIIAESVFLIVNILATFWYKKQKEYDICLLTAFAAGVLAASLFDAVIKYLK